MEIKLISESFIKPKYEVEASKNPHYLSPIDLAFLPLKPMQMGILFPKKPQNVETFIQKLRTSLSMTLVHAYPLAGQLATQKFPDEHAMWVYVDCNKGPGVRVIHATIDMTVSDIVSSIDVPLVVQSFFDLGEATVVNYDGHTRPLCSFQVTELKDGLFFSVTMNHSVADGISVVCFLTIFLKIFHRLDFSDNKPIFEPLFPDNYGPMIKLPYLERDEFISNCKHTSIITLRERIFKIETRAISSLKAKANRECGIDTITSLQALSAFMWKCITRSRKLGPNEETTLAIPADVRTRLNANPPLSQDNFGNYVHVVEATCKVKDLLDNGLGWTASLINQRLAATNDNEIRAKLVDYVEDPSVITKDRVSMFNKPNRVVIGGSLGSSWYEIEFGFGKAIAHRGGYANKNDGRVEANPGIREGTTELEVCLQYETLRALELDHEFMLFVS